MKKMEKEKIFFNETVELNYFNIFLSLGEIIENYKRNNIYMTCYLCDKKYENIGGIKNG